MNDINIKEKLNKLSEKINGLLSHYSIMIDDIDPDISSVKFRVLVNHNKGGMYMYQELTYLFIQNINIDVLAHFMKRQIDDNVKILLQKEREL